MKINEALNELWTYTGEMFESSDEEKKLAKDGVIPSFDLLKDKWTENVKQVFSEAGLEVPKDRWMATGGRQAIHSEYLGHMLGDMQYLVRAYPNDKW
jgi:ring-1,2-phenylacetyl-CoA epoxidase subunit PaaC